MASSASSSSAPLSPCWRSPLFGLACFSLVCLITGTAMLEPDILNHLVIIPRGASAGGFAIGDEYTQAHAHSVPSSAALLASVTSRSHTSDGHRAVRDSVSACRALFPSASSAVQSPSQSYFLVGCAVEAVLTPSPTCSPTHSIDQYLTVVATSLSLNLRYLASSIVSDRPHVDAFVGWNDGERYLIDLQMDRAIPTQTLSGGSGKSLNESMTELKRYADATASAAAVVTIKDVSVSATEWASADRAAMASLAALLRSKYCFARVYRPVVTDFFARDRFGAVLDMGYRGFIPHRVTMDTALAPLVIAVQLDASDAVDAQQRAVTRVHRVLRLVATQLQGTLRQAAVHLFQARTATVTDRNDASAFQIPPVGSATPVLASVTLHRNVSDVLALHHFVTADIFVSAAALSNTDATIAAFARFPLVSFLPAQAPLDSVLAFNSETNAVEWPANLPRLRPSQWRNLQKFRSARECTDWGAQEEIDSVHLE